MKICITCKKEKKDKDFKKKCDICSNCRNKCEHGIRKNRCVKCKGSGICEHNQIKYRCVKCKGSGICEHNTRRETCVKCKGSGICEHKKRIHRCVKCKGSGICEHNVLKSTCRKCKGNAICEHNNVKYDCKLCGGSKICEHNIHRILCKICDGSQICEHDIHRAYCKICKGSRICEHNCVITQCKICDLSSYLRGLVNRRVYYCLDKNKIKHTIEYLGTSIEEYKNYLEKQFKEDMNWENIGSLWHIDHIIPLKYKENGIVPSLEEQIKRLHYTNTQPLYATENLKKGNRYIG